MKERYSNTVLSVPVVPEAVTYLTPLLPNDIASKLLFFWTGTIEGNQLVNDLGDNNLVIIDKDFTGPEIPGGSSSKLMIPDLDIYKAADTDTLESQRRGDSPATGDDLWTNGSGVLQEVTISDLISYDYKNTLVKYSRYSTYDISWIAIKNPNMVFTKSQIDSLHASFELWVYWTGGWNIYGDFKNNRLL